MNNSLILSTFISQIDEYLDDISKTYSVDSRFERGRLYLEGIKKSNPRIIITTWKTMVTDKYADQIEAGDIEYFLNKDFTEDAPGNYTPTVDGVIQELRATVRRMSDENKAVSLKYIQNLCKLSKLYVY
jgi:hypothetical protein